MENLIAALTAGVIFFVIWRTRNSTLGLIGAFLCIGLAKNCYSHAYQVQAIDKPLVILAVVAIIVLSGELAVWTIKKIKTKKVEQMAD